ncbi:MAG: ABC-2 transporter permease, partial [Chloroflexota bacterium]|nr:ABC-2 transporter permease [Chloroflexota bacterium]
IFRGLRHDRRTLALIIVAPILAMCIFGVAFSGEVQNVGVVVVNLDEGPIAETIVANLDDEIIDVRFMQNESDAVSEVEAGEAWAAIVFPEGFSQNIMAKIQGDSSAGDTDIILRADKSNVNIAAAVTRTVADAMMATLSQTGRELPVAIAESPVYGKDAEFIDFFVPGIMAFAVFLLTTLLTLLSFVGERTNGTLERLKASPMRDSEIVAGYAMAFGIIGMFQASLLLIVATLVFKIIIVGNPFLAYIIVSLLAVVSVSLGILLSAAAKREAQAVQFLPLIVLPTFLLSGIFWPVEAIPSILRPLSYVIPPTYGVEAMRSVMLRGWGLSDIWLEIVVLLGFALVFLSVSVRSLQKSKG